jgi:hypothetical protein
MDRDAGVGIVVALEDTNVANVANVVSARSRGVGVGSHAIE